MEEQGFRVDWLCRYTSTRMLLQTPNMKILKCCEVFQLLFQVCFSGGLNVMADFATMRSAHCTFLALVAKNASFREICSASGRREWILISVPWDLSKHSFAVQEINSILINHRFCFVIIMQVPDTLEIKHHCISVQL